MYLEVKSQPKHSAQNTLLCYILFLLFHPSKPCNFSLANDLQFYCSKYHLPKIMWFDNKLIALYQNLL